LLPSLLLHQVRMDFLARRPLIALFLLSLVMALAFQGSRGLWDPDEGRYSNVALEMLHTGDPITLYRHHDSFHFTKPPVTTWAMAASMELFGRNEWAVRLPMALAFVLTTLLVFQLGKVFVPARPWLPALIYLSAPFPYMASNTINTDSLLAAGETLAMYCYVRARFAGGSPRWIDGMWAAFGLVFLTKGPPGLLPLLAIVVFQMLYRADAPRLLRPLGLLAFALIGFSWYVAVVSLHPGLLQYFLGHEVVARVASDELDRHPQWYGAFQIYLPTLVFGLLPWLPMALWKIRGARPRWSSAEPTLRFLWLWFTIPLIIFSLARSRLPLYVLPLVAPACLLMARALVSVSFESGLRKALLALWLLLLVGVKAWAAYPPQTPFTNTGDPKSVGYRLTAVANDAIRGLQYNTIRNLADQLRPMIPGQAQEIIFVEDKTRYALHLYLDAEVAKVSFRPWPKAISDADFDKTVAQSLRDNHGGRVYFFKRPVETFFLTEVRDSGHEPVLLGVIVDPKRRSDQDRMVYTLRGDFPGH
jgi:4-amino-4-deoxy-L-arabinose transferase-like glycosyltransferase